MPNSGNQLIDRQHRAISEIIARAAESVRNGGEGFTDAVLNFYDALAAHFALEGVIFRGAGFDAADEHDKAHAAILDRVRAIIDAQDVTQGTSVRHAAIDELEQILYDHELLEDSAYWEAVRFDPDEQAVVWDPELETGIDWIDEQHRHLAAIINQLALAARAGDGEALSELADRFLRHARQHFAAEERYLIAQGIPVSTHRAEHRRLLGELDRMMAGSESSAMADHYLRYWIFDHIRTTDMADFGPVSPDRAD
ncbi:hypothetical protein A6A04_04420 [Paramagnetospirillum marisnigri]|uniref:Hemerythrin-like domain-containing protein n=2 Tax=Paramagnetospirillum marisnigri TaxID=1285242 RepID=A0A178MH52_9PROT|nr:hypothetical protein A6A04_04420 [Paramagnetospirillum marisnigri]